jgi:hypothetical protein
MTNQDTKSPRSALNMVCIVVMAVVVAAKALWLSLGLTSVGLTKPMLLFACALLILAAATWFLASGNRNIGIGLAWVGVILAFYAGQLGGVPAGPDHSRFEEQYRNHALDYLFLIVAHVQFLLLRRIPVIPTPNAG